ncbi:hypothetical protein PPL_11116 [Heterostelium album PN500]|uniref:Uncharacterized protein n=1 Tax=Heterostelium pallidum (strain ATCC 26659 / Pp 5 / PN500) TaxID=670386 RepID=D3BSZ5_HETP5|nr:hypothetical protein PPL_11116 [Heterostelium album PN500]EFA75610.1 hypothetical protein PPL_11116 [Heterostelium album PN500]|eukprot:XP_020427744.1 hypothetical protein PPL_11116 [Heterostelium album PN500]
MSTKYNKIDNNNNNVQPDEDKSANKVRFSDDLTQYHHYSTPDYGSFPSIASNDEEEKKKSIKQKLEEEFDSFVKQKLYHTLYITTSILTVFFLVVIIILLSLASTQSTLKSLNYKEESCMVYATTRVWKNNVTDCNDLNDGLISVEFDDQFYTGVPDYAVTDDPKSPFEKMCYQGIYNITIKSKHVNSSIEGPWSRSSTWIVRYLQAIPIREQVSCFVDKTNIENVLWTNPPTSPYAIFMFSMVCVLALASVITTVVAYQMLKKQRIINEGTPLLTSRHREFSFR